MDRLFLTEAACLFGKFLLNYVQILSEHIYDERTFVEDSNIM
jgi:hypothetical protein